MSSSQNVSDPNFNVEPVQYPPRAVGSGINGGSSIGPTRRYVEDRQDRMRLTIQNAFFGGVKATSDVVKRLGVSIDSKTLPGLLGPGSAQRQMLRASRPDAGPSTIGRGESSPQFPAPPTPLHTQLHEDASNPLPNSQFGSDKTLSSQDDQGARLAQSREHPIHMQLDSPSQINNQLANSQQSTSGKENTQREEQQQPPLHLPLNAPKDGSNPLQNPQTGPDGTLSSQEGQDERLAQSHPIHMQLDSSSQTNNQLANSQQSTSGKKSIQPEEQQHPSPQFFPSAPQDRSNPFPNSQPKSIDGQNPPLNQQLPQAQLESQQHPEGPPPFSGPFDFRELHQPGATFQPVNFETNPFLLQNRNSRNKVNTNGRRDSSSQGQMLGRRGRDWSPQASASKRLRRARSAELQISPSSQSLMSNGISPHVVLQILEERDKWTREGLLNDMRLTVAETLRNTGSTALTTTDTDTLTEGVILKIIQPLLVPNLMADTDHSAHQSEDIDMDAPLASAREVAAKLLAEIRKNRTNVPSSPSRPNTSSSHSSRPTQGSSSPHQATSSQSSSHSPDQASESQTDTDNALPVSYKGARAKSSKRNAYHADIRSFLIAEKVRIPCTTRGVAPFRPQCPASEDVQKYEDDQIGGPTKDNILIAWNQPLSSASPWNWDAITLLTDKAHQLLKESKNEYDQSWLKLPELRKSIISCLKETKNIMKEPSVDSSSRRLSSRSKVTEKSLPRARRRARKISKVVSRHKTVEENEYRDPQLWKAARDVVDAVGVDGMSGEDTDGEPPGREKRLLRVPVKWINPELTGLFHIIDTWKSAVQDESFSTPRGNRPLTRLATSKVPVEGHATKGLPRNWYDETWYKSQSDPKKILLNTLPPRPIPCIQPRQ